MRERSEVQEPLDDVARQRISESDELLRRQGHFRELLRRYHEERRRAGENTTGASASSAVPSAMFSASASSVSSASSEGRTLSWSYLERSPERPESENAGSGLGPSAGHQRASGDAEGLHHATGVSRGDGLSLDRSTQLLDRQRIELRRRMAEPNGPGDGAWRLRRGEQADVEWSERFMNQVREAREIVRAGDANIQRWRNNSHASAATSATTNTPATPASNPSNSASGFVSIADLIMGGARDRENNNGNSSNGQNTRPTHPRWHEVVLNTPTSMEDEGDDSDSDDDDFDDAVFYTVSRRMREPPVPMPVGSRGMTEPRYHRYRAPNLNSNSGPSSGTTTGTGTGGRPVTRSGLGSGGNGTTTGTGNASEFGRPTALAPRFLRERMIHRLRANSMMSGNGLSGSGPGTVTGRFGRLGRRLDLGDYMVSSSSMSHFVSGWKLIGCVFSFSER